MQMCCWIHVCVWPFHLMCQNVNVVADIAGRGCVLLLALTFFLRVLDLHLALHVGLFDHLHLNGRHGLSMHMCVCVCTREGAFVEKCLKRHVKMNSQMRLGYIPGFLPFMDTEARIKL